MGESGLEGRAAPDHGTLLDTSTGEREPAPPSPPQKSLQGKAIDRYVVLYELGSGGMGVVYAAYDPELDRKLALKLLHPDRGSTNAQTRLLREAKAIAQLSHESIVTVHDVGTYEGRIFVAMEFLEGITMRRWLQQGPRTWREVVAVLQRAGEGLAVAHAADLVHRDFKPDNIMVQPSGRVVVLDFGLVRRVQSRGDSREPEVPDVEPTSDVIDIQVEDQLSQELTRGGAKLGTPAYMAPEQQLGQRTDARTDQFAFCVVLWEALYGVRPFDGGSPTATGMQVVRGQIQDPPKGVNVPAWLRRVLLRGLSTDPEQRYPNMRALLADLGRDRVRGWRRWGTMSVAVMLAVGVGWFAMRGDTDRCAGGRESWRGIWEQGTSAAIGDAFERTRASYARVAAARVERVLDGYVDEWIASYRAACEATFVHHEQSQATHEQRSSCLDSRRRSAQALVEELMAADAAVVEHAVEAVNALPRLADCNDAEALAVGVPSPQNLATGERVKALRDALADAHAKESAARYDQALGVVDAVTTEATDVGYAPLVAEAQLSRGEILERKGDFSGAEASLLEAILAAKASRHDRVEAHAWVQLVWITGVERMQTEQGHVWARFAKAALDRLGHADVLEAELDHNIAGLLYREGRLDEALIRYQRALAEQERLLGPDDPRIAMTLNHIGNVLMEQRQFGPSREYCERSLAERRRILGDRHPRVAASLNNLAELARKQGATEQSLELAEESLQIAGGTGTQEEVIALVLEADAFDTLGRHALAVARYERLVQIRAAASNDGGPQVVEALRNLAEAHRRAGDPEAAIRAYERAMDRAGPGASPEMARALLGLAAVQVEVGRTEAARITHDRAQSVAATITPPDSALIGQLATQKSKLFPDALAAP